MKRPLKVPVGWVLGLLLFSLPPFFNYALAILAIPFILVLLGHAVLHLLRNIRRYRSGY